MVAHLSNCVNSFLAVKALVTLDISMLYAKILPSGPHRLAWSRTQAFQAWYMGSNPVGGTGRALPHLREGFFDEHMTRR